MKKLFLALALLLSLIFVLILSLNKSFVMPLQERYELNKDSLNTYLGEEVVIDSVSHVLVNINVLKKEYTTDKGVTISFDFVNNYFKDSITTDTSIPNIDGMRLEQDTNNNE